MKFVKYLNIFLLLVFFVACDKDDDNSNDDNSSEEVPKVLNTTPTDWMGQIIDFYQEQPVTFTDICFPRAHDAGNYQETLCTVGANACNTRTQEISITEMLETGIREFDMRPILAEDGEFYTHHYTGCGGLGCNGDSFENMLLAIKTFLDNHAEIVVVDINHFCETNAADQNLLALITNTLGERIYTQAAEDNAPLLRKNLNEIVDLASNTGKAIVTYESLTETAATRALGMFSESGSFATAGSYSNKFVVEEMKADQIAKFQNFEATGESIFEISWTLTQNTNMAIDCALGDSTNSIFNLASLANAALATSINELIADSTIRKGKIPNAISVDRANTFVTEECIKITKLNLE